MSGPQRAERAMVALGAWLLAAALACHGEDPQPPPPPRTTPPSEAQALETPAPEPSADQGPPLSRDEVRLVVRSKMSVVRGCFDAGLERDPDAGGRVVLRFDILASGRTDRIEIDSDEVGAGVGACLVEALATWQFPQPRAGQTMTIAYPFVFSSERSLRAAGLPRVEGTIKPAAVGAVFDARRAELDECIPEAAKGSVSLAFVVDDAGAVPRISLLDTSLDRKTSACVKRTVSSWRFPPAAKGDEARVNHELWW